VSGDDGLALMARLTDELQASRRRLAALAIGSPTARRLSRLVGRLEQRVARPPRIVLLGEFNAGKTTLANALIGADVLPTSIHANTRLPLHARYSAVPFAAVELEDGERRPLGEVTLSLLRSGQARMLHVGLPAERLKQIELIDTPGLASDMARLDGGNIIAFARASIALWCTASTQAWKATERAAFEELPERLRRRSLLVATLADSLNTDRDRSRVAARLRGETGKLFQGLVMVAAAEIDELRRNPGTADHAERWESSGGAALDAAVGRLVAGVLAEREAATARILERAAARLAGSSAAS
jgi:hypothetical protein